MLIKDLYNLIYNNKYNDNLFELYKILNCKLIIDKPLNLQSNSNKNFFIDDFEIFLVNYVNYLHSNKNQLIEFLLSTTRLNFEIYMFIINNRIKLISIFKKHLKIKTPRLNLNKINIYKNENIVLIRNKFKMFYDKSIFKILDKINLNEYYLTLNNNLEIIDFYHSNYDKYRFYIDYKNKLKINI